MEIIKVIGVGFVTAVSAVLLKATKPELSFAVTLTGVFVILLFIVDELQNTMIVFAEISKIAGVGNGLLKVLLKIVGVGYITEFGAGILNDFGSNAVADKVVLGGKIAIITLSLPVLKGLISMIGGFLQLV